MGLLEIYPYNGKKPAQIGDYETRLSKTLCELTHEASSRLSPVGVYWRNGESDLAVSRRRKNEHGTTEHRPNRNGYYDPNLWVLELEGSRGRAILYSYACHPVVLYRAEWQTISADFPGRTRLALKARLGEATHVQFLQGLAGSVRPRILADFDKEEFVRGSRETLERTGERLADDLMNTLNAAADEIEVDLHAVMGYAPIRPGPPLDHGSVEELGETWGGADVYWRERSAERAALQSSPALARRLDSTGPETPDRLHGQRGGGRMASADRGGAVWVASWLVGATASTTTPTCRRMS